MRERPAACAHDFVARAAAGSSAAARTGCAHAGACGRVPATRRAGCPTVQLGRLRAARGSRWRTTTAISTMRATCCCAHTSCAGRVRAEWRCAYARPCGAPYGLHRPIRVTRPIFALVCARDVHAPRAAATCVQSTLRSCHPSRCLFPDRGVPSWPARAEGVIPLDSPLGRRGNPPFGAGIPGKSAWGNSGARPGGLIQILSSRADVRISPTSELGSGRTCHRRFSADSQSQRAVAAALRESLSESDEVEGRKSE